MGIFNKKKEVDFTDPFDLDWGEVSPDTYDESNNKSSYICSHYYLTEESIKYSQILTSGRVLWYQQYLPAYPNNSVCIDIRGQHEIADSLQKRQEVVKTLKEKILTTSPSINVEVYTLG